MSYNCKFPANLTDIEKTLSSIQITIRTFNNKYFYFLPSSMTVTLLCTQQEPHVSAFSIGHNQAIKYSKTYI